MANDREALAVIDLILVRCPEMAVLALRDGKNLVSGHLGKINGTKRTGGRDRLNKSPTKA
jgi:hypothetical protein